jgi:hypothetical protein
VAPEIQSKIATIQPDDLSEQPGPWATRGPAAAGVSPLEGSIAVVSWSLQKAIAAERWDLVQRFTTIIERLTERLVGASG